MGKKELTHLENIENNTSYLGRSINVKLPSNEGDQEMDLISLLLSGMSLSLFGEVAKNKGKWESLFNTQGKGLYAIAVEQKKYMAGTYKNTKDIVRINNDILAELKKQSTNISTNDVVGETGKKEIDVDVKSDKHTFTDFRDLVEVLRKYNKEADKGDIITEIEDAIKSIIKISDELKKADISGFKKELSYFSDFMQGISTLISMGDIEDKLYNAEDNIELLKELVTGDFTKLINEISSLAQQSETAKVSIDDINDVMRMLIYSLDELPGLASMLKYDFKVNMLLSSTMTLNFITDLLNKIKLYKKTKDTLKNVKDAFEILNEIGNEVLKGNTNLKTWHSKLVEVQAIKNILKTLSKFEKDTSTPLEFIGFDETLTNFGEVLEKLKLTYDEDIKKVTALSNFIDSFIILMSNIDASTFNEDNAKALCAFIEGDMMDILTLFRNPSDFSIAIETLFTVDEKVLKNIDNIISVVKKLGDLSNVIISAKITEAGFAAFEKSADHIINIVNKFKDIKQEDIDKLDESVKILMKVIISAGLILIAGSLAMKFIDPANLILFAATLIVFITPIILFLKFITKSAENALEGAEELMLIVGASALVLLFGGLVMKLIEVEDLFAFTIALGAFVSGILLVYALAGRIINKEFVIAEEFATLVAVSAGVMLLGALLYRFINFKDVLGFTVALGAFMLALCGVYWVGSLLFKRAIRGAKEFGIMIIISAGLMIFGALIGNWIWKHGKQILKFCVALAGFTIGILIPFIIASKLFGRAIKTAKEFTRIVIVSAAVMILGPWLIEKIYGDRETGYKAILEWAAYLGGFILAVSGALKLAGSGGVKMLAVAVTFGLVVAVAAAALIGGPYIIQEYIKDGNTLDEKLNYIMKFAIFLGVYTVTMGLILAGAGALMSNILMGGVALLALEALTIGAGYSLALFYESTKNIKFETLLEGVKSMTLVFGALGAMAVVLGTLVMGPQAALIAAGAGALAILEALVGGAGVVMYIIGKSLKELDSAKKVDFKGIGNVIEGYIGILKTLVKEIGLGLAIKLPLITPALLTSGLALSAIAFAVQNWASLNVPTEFDENGKPIAFRPMTPKDIDAAAVNITNVLKAIGETIVNVVKDNSEIFEAPLLGLGKSPFEIAVRGFKASGEMLDNVAEGIQSWAMLKIPTGFDKEGKATGFRLMDENDIKKASENIMCVLLTIGLSIVNVVKGNEELFEGALAGLGKSPFEIAVRAFTASGKMLEKIAAGIQAWAMLKVPTGFDKNGNPTGYVRMKSGWIHAASKNIGFVLTTIGEAIVKTVKGNEELFGGLLAGLGDSPIEVAVKAFTQSGLMLSMLAMGIQSWAMLKAPTEFNPDGTPKGYTQLKDTHIAEAKKHIGEVLVALGEAICTTVDKYPQYFSRGANSPAMIASQAVNNTSSALMKIMYVVKQLSDKNFKEIILKMNNTDPNNLGVMQSVKSLLTNICEIISLFLKPVEGSRGAFMKFFAGEKTFAQHLNDNIEEIEESVKSIDTFSKNLVQILDGLSKIGDKLAAKRTGLESITNNEFIESLRNGMGNLMGLVCGILELDNDKLEDLNDAKENFEVFDYFTDILEQFINSVVKFDSNGQKNLTMLTTGIIGLYGTTSLMDKPNLFFKDLVNDTERFIQAINTLDLSKISSLSQLTQALNEIANKFGNLDELTDALANKVTVVLLELVNQLRTAETVIRNAHELQERRKKLIESNIKKVKEIMSQHMIVEIGKKEEPEQLSSGTPGTIKYPGETNTGGGGEDTTAELESPETPNQGAGDAEKEKIKNGVGSAKPLTADEFVNLMKKHMSDSIWTS